MEHCTNCKHCLKACFADAMQDDKDNTWVKTENCVGCGGCYSVCPALGAIEIEPTEAEYAPMVHH